MAFSDTQVKQLRAKLDGRHVRTRAHLGETIAYLEAWHVIAEANRIFGFDGWERETVELVCLSEADHAGVHVCAYRARARVRVRAGADTVAREGHGVGHARAGHRGEAHERALKAAESDATKRALATFGNPFGLALYDPERRQVTARRGRKVTWTLIGPDGARLGRYEDPRAYCTALRRLAEASGTAGALKALWRRNQPTVDRLRQIPELATERGEPYADVLQRLLRRRLDALSDRREAAADAQNPGRVDKTVLALPAPKRVRDADHLRYVRGHACLVCGRRPTHAHHLRHAQPQATGAKVGDDWAVPLCATHHRALHRTGDERAWWQRQGIDPLAAAERFWARTRERRQRSLAVGEGRGRPGARAPAAAE